MHDLNSDLYFDLIVIFFNPGPNNWPKLISLASLQECYKGKKFAVTIDEDLFTLTIKNPEAADSGRYTCVVRECNDLTCKAYLEVERKSSAFSATLTVVAALISYTSSSGSGIRIQQDARTEEARTDQEDGQDEVQGRQG
jgi:hypothetical protein